MSHSPNTEKERKSFEAERAGFFPTIRRHPLFFGIASVSAYVILFSLLFSWAGPRTSPLIAIPVSVLAWMCGLKLGIFAALMALPVNTLLFNLMGSEGWDVALRGGGGPGLVALIFIAAGVGRLRDLEEERNRELSKRLKAEVALEGSEERFRHLVEQAGDAFFVHDVEGKFLDVNQHACESLGYTREELLEMSVPDIDLNFDSNEIIEMWKDIVPGAPVTKEGTHRRKDGSTFPVELSLSMVTSGDRRYALAMARDISERVAARKALEAGEKRYRDLFENSGELIQSVSAEGRGEYVNPKWLQTLGYTELEAHQLKFTDLLRPDQIEHCTRIFDALQRGESFSQLETVFLTKEGREVYVEGSTSPHMEGDRMIGTRGFFRDVTERKKAEQALHDSEAKWRSLIENTPDVIATVDRKGKILSAGKHADLVVGTVIYDYISPKYWDTVRKAYEHLFRTGEPDSYEMEAVMPNGETAWYSSTIVPQKEEGEIVAALALGREITEQKRWEQKLKQSEERFRTLFESAPDAYYLTDMAGTFLDGNRTAEQISGYKREELIGKNFLRLNLLSLRELPKAAFLLAQNALGRPTGPDEFLLNRKDGKQIHLDIRTFPVDLGGQTVVLGIARDVTERRQAEETMRLIVEGTSQVTGSDFFASLVRHMAQALRVRWAFVAELADEKKSRVRTLALWDGGDLISNFEYSLEGTPCERVVEGEQSFYSERVAELFPQDEWLREIGAEAYLGIPLYDSSKRFLGHMGILHDKPLLKRFSAGSALKIFAARAGAELERLRAEEALQEMRTRLEHLLSSSPAVVYSCKASGDFGATFISANVTAQLGYQPREFLENSRFWMERIHPDDVEHVMADSARIFERGHVVHEYRFLHKDGTYRWMYDELRPVFDAEGKPKELVGSRVDITDRKNMEEEIRKSEERYRDLIENIEEMVCTHDLEGKLITVNQALARNSGYPVEEMVGRNLADFLDPSMKPRFPDYLKTLTEQGSAQGFMKVKTRGGEIRVLEYSNTVRRNGMLTPIVRGVARDVTERLQAEERIQKLNEELEQRVFERTKELRESQKLFQALATASPVGIFRTDIEGKCLYVNERWCEIAGLTLEEAMGSGWERALHPEDRDRIVSEWYHAAVQGKWFRGEGRFRRPDGKVTWFYAQAATEKDQDGNFLGYVGTLTDITERKRTEEALQESETKHRMVIENIDEIIYAVRTPTATLSEGSVSLVSPHVENILGYSPEEFVANPQLWYDALHPEDQKTVEESTRRFFKKKEPATRVYRLRHKKTGLYRWMEDRIVPQMDEEGNVVGYFGVARDITERRNLEGQLRQSQKMEAVGRLAGGVAHDFNNLLMIIGGYGEMLLNELPKDDPRAVNAVEILKAADRASALSRQLLTFSRKEMVEPKVLDLNRVVTDTEKMLRRLIGEDVELQAVMEPELRRVKADWGQMQQIFLNLAVNGRDAMPKGGRLAIETANVDLSREFTQKHPGSHPGPHVRLSVTDTGSGMDAETQAHIFEPFFTTKEKGVGTGLGLATVYGIVKQWSGYISVRSQEGKGTTFSIYFPQVEENLAEEAEAVVEPPEPGTETILVVEDEISVRQLARDFLESRGYKVLEAPGPLEAIEMVQQYEQPIHLLLTDIVMPKMNGSELAGKVLSWSPKTKVLYMSGYTDDPLIWRGFQRRDKAFLQKPFTLDALAREIRNVLDN